ncbi:hypothetical protein M2375_000411 [Comamonas sp. BIGb0152]|uniref:hypothetical protein n=1 Tax=Comamonas sp. BIGb0152 TaxID=2940601 RepID=UPI0021695853|nr:hypothetical protein [Comamonas sp. BIGb0152]MCS4292216.1 hypothetical protein [Comamonas sp. BIGb0152]
MDKLSLFSRINGYAAIESWSSTYRLRKAANINQQTEAERNVAKHPTGPAACDGLHMKRMSLARKLLRVAFAIWKGQETFNPEQLLPNAA